MEVCVGETLAAGARVSVAVGNVTVTSALEVAARAGVIVAVSVARVVVALPGWPTRHSQSADSKHNSMIKTNPTPALTPTPQLM